MKYVFSRKLILVILATFVISGCSNYSVVTPKRAQRSGAAPAGATIPVVNKDGSRKISPEQIKQRADVDTALNKNVETVVGGTESVEWNEKTSAKPKPKINNKIVSAANIQWKDGGQSPSSAPMSVSQGMPNDEEFPPLVVTEDTPPSVLYRRGSRDTVLADEGEDANLVRRDTDLDDQKIETAVTAKAREIYRDLKEAETRLDVTTRKAETVGNKSTTQISEYYSLVANISAALRTGTTPGNPILVDRWNAAQAKLNDLPKNVNMINNLAVDLSSQASRAAFILESTESAFHISGAVDADHRMLRKIQDRCSQIITDLNRMIMDVNKEMNRIDALLKTERANMQTLSLGISKGELYGESLANNMEMKSLNEMAKIQTPAQRKLKPLVIIRFDKPNIDYERPLYRAVSAALDKYPSARFSILTISASNENKAKESIDKQEARKRGEEVMDALVKMGLPTSRIVVESTTSEKATATEIHIFLK